MKKKSYALLSIIILQATIALSQSAPQLNVLTPFASGLTSPVCIANAGDSRLFIVDQHGIVKIVDSSGIVNPQTYLNIVNKVKYGGEQGLLGIAFHPLYAYNGYFYVNYIGPGDSTHISRFSVSAVNPNLADPASELKLLTIYQPFTNHNGGDLKFGPDGYLYIGMGDGGSSNDPGNRAQNPMQFLGKMLRIDVDNGSPYTIPATNPFYGNPDTLNEIWALGLRNPWRYSFDRLTGDLWIGDVGQGQVEEIDFQLAGDPGGENYGWRCYEGNNPNITSGCPPLATFTFPIYSYLHSPECSVTGGYVYRGLSTSPFYGWYFFADYCSNRIWTLHNVSGNWVKEDYGQFSGNNFSTFGEDAYGQLYIAGITSGTIYKVLGNPVTKNLNINVYLEGLYQGGAVMSQAMNGTGSPRWGNGIADKVTVELHNQFDYSIIEHTINNAVLSTAGHITLTGATGIPSMLNESYYITIKHRNSIETTSSIPVSFAGSVITYNFDAFGKAFGDNLKQMNDGTYAIFGGDINQDSILDSSDMIAVDNDAINFLDGYLLTDANGDGLIDSSDMIIVDNNVTGFVSSILP